MFERLPGFRDFYPDACAVRNFVFRVWRQSARKFGFSEYDCPVLESLDLFREKSGNEIVEQLFTFTDKGGRDVALRPEMTPSLARLVGARANSLKRPIKWFSIGEQFRYEKPQQGRLRSHYQLNADIFGEAGAAADAELMALCLDCMTSLGLVHGDIVLRLSDRKLWMLFLETQGLAGPMCEEILQVVDKLERRKREQSLARLESLVGSAAEPLLTDIETLTGIRNLEELTGFLSRKTLDPRLLAFLEERFSEWAELLETLRCMGLEDFLRIDLGIVRGLAYYTGFVYEVFSRQGETRSLAAGGRYDALIEKLGYAPMPAVGFGMGDVTLTILLDQKQLLPRLIEKPDLYCLFGGLKERVEAHTDIAALRKAGLAVEYPLRQVGFGRQFRLANASGARVALIYGSDEVEQGQVRLKDLLSGEELLVARENLTKAVLQGMESGSLSGSV